MVFLKVGLKDIDSEGFTLPTEYWKGIVATDDYVDMDANNEWNLYNASFKVLRQDYLDRSSRLGQKFDFDLGDYYKDEHNMLVVESDVPYGSKEYDDCMSLYEQFGKIEESQREENNEPEFGLYDELKILHDATNWNNRESIRQYNERARELREEYADKADSLRDAVSKDNSSKNVDKSDKYNSYLETFGDSIKMSAEEYREFYDDSMLDALDDELDGKAIEESKSEWNVFKSVSGKNIFDRVNDNYKTVRIFGDKGPINMVIDSKFIKENGVNSQGNNKFDVVLPSGVDKIVVESKDGERRKHVATSELLEKHNKSLDEVSRWHESNANVDQPKGDVKDLEGIDK